MSLLSRSCFLACDYTTFNASSDGNFGHEIREKICENGAPPDSIFMRYHHGSKLFFLFFWFDFSSRILFLTSQRSGLLESEDDLFADTSSNTTNVEAKETH